MLGGDNQAHCVRPLSLIIKLNKVNKITWGSCGEEFKSKKEIRLSILKANRDKTNVEIAKLIQEKEPATKIKSLEIWIARNRNI